MIQNSGLNIGLMAEARDNQKEKIEKLFTDLHQENDASLRNNPLYRRYGIINLAWILLVLAGIVFLYMKKEMVSDKLDEIFLNIGISTADREVLIPNLVLLLWAAALLLVVIYGSTLLRMLYSNSQGRREKKISACAKVVLKRVDAKDMDDFRNAAMAAAEEGNREFSAGKKNDIGKRIGYIRDCMDNSCKRARILKGILSPVFSAVYYLFGFVVIWLLKDKLEPGRIYTYIWLTLFGAYTFYAIDVVLCSIGEYLGKLMRPFGCLLAAVYAGFLWYITGIVDEPFFGSAALSLTNGPGFLSQIKVSYVVILLQFIAMVTGVLAGDFSGMREKWKYPYNLTSGKVIRRMLWSVPWVLIAWYIGMRINEPVTFVFFALVWWRSMPLFKPFGSFLHEFFGRGKSISIGLMSFALFIMNYLHFNGPLDIKALIMFGLALVVYVVFGLIVYAVNEYSDFFIFMERFE